MKHINDQIMDAMLEIQKRLHQDATINLSISKLTILQLKALMFINSRKDVDMSDIAVHFHITKPTATVLLDKLVVRNLVSRQSNENDRRITRVALTDEGTVLLNESKKHWNKHVSTILGCLSEQDKAELFRILQVVLNKVS
ncbi:winged helix-turn-helix transcriptional regulator [Candidatus Roizmanbacteria bacterium]|nr:winged helix-turn-helix transcriptional regulator [Candidatus Roizmanbacteria bacterium]